MTYGICYIFALVICLSHCHKIEEYPLFMPDVQPFADELYLCTPVRVNYSKDYYIVGFKPKTNMHIAHHMLLYGCSKPGSSKLVWNCGEMASNDAHKLEDQSPCKEGSQIIYAWARDAPALTLPDQVGFKVGGNSKIQYLVLQVHYHHKFASDLTDNSGVILQYTEYPLKKLAGVLLLGTTGQIDPMQVVHMESACEIREPKVLHPFAFRTHTHSLGKVVSGFKVENINGNHKWTALGKRDPLEPEMFYPVNDATIKINKGDIVAARCTMNSTRSKVTYIGGTNNDEMCNYYLLYYVDGGNPLDMKYCFTSGPPLYSWKSAGFNNIPEIEASTL